MKFWACFFGLFLSVLSANSQELLTYVDVSGVEIIGFYDFNGDDELDMLFTNFSTSDGTIGWIENAGNNTMTVAHPLPGWSTSAFVYVYDQINVIDFDQDGDLDIIAIAGYYDTGGYPIGFGDLVLALNNGVGEFEIILTDAQIGEIGLIDLNGDGIVEVLATYSNNLQRFDWNGAGFTQSVVWTVPPGSNAPGLLEVEIGDINGDGFDEPVCIQATGYEATYHYGYIIAFTDAHNNIWTPTTLTTSFTGSNPLGGALSHWELLKYLELADAEGDGDLDLYFNALDNNGVISAGPIYCKLNNGSGVFTTFCGGGSFTLGGPYSQPVYLGNDGTPDFFTKYHFGIPQENRLNRNAGCGFPGAAETIWTSNAGDWNGDGHLDLFQRIDIPNAFGTYTKKLVPHLGDAFGNFEASTDTIYLNYAAVPSSFGTYLMKADWNGDNIKDGLVKYNNTLTQYFMSDQGLMYDERSWNIAQTNLQFDYAAGDFNNDGFDDLLFTTGDATYGVGNRDFYLRRNINGYLEGATNIIYDNTGASSSRLRALDVYDINNDGNLDIVFIVKTTGSNGSLFAKLGNGDYTFGTTITALSGIGLTDNWLPMNIIDFDGDGFKDIVIGGKWLHSNGTGTYVLSHTIANAALKATVADYDSDGDWDYICTNQNNYGTTYVYTNNGDWTFTSQTFYAGGFYDHFVYDIDQDGDKDILTGQLILTNDGGVLTQSNVVSYYYFLDIVEMPSGEAVVFYDTGGRRLRSMNLIQSLSCGDFTVSISVENGALTAPVGNENTVYTWTNCETNEIVQQGNNNVYTPTTAGDYKVLITQGACQGETECLNWQILPYDLNGDQVMDINDLITLLENFGCVGVSCEYDLDGNGQVGVEDLMILVGMM